MAAHTYFAIGDIHGEADKLARLHAAILDRIAFEGGPAKIVHLRDYIDRGPNSRSVIERVMALEARFAGDANIQVVSLRGNHEQMLLDALDAAAELEPDVILLDWNMPIMSGMDFLRAYRSSVVSPLAKVIFCTTENGIGHIKAAIDAGADEYVMKPFDRETLEAKLQIVGCI